MIQISTWPKAQLIHQKLSEAFDNILKNNLNKMKCTSGCAKCCHKKFSIFSWEAHEIICWFKSLSEDEKQDIIKKWSTYGEKACSFLNDEQCTIYSVRPSICRTQGAPFYIEGQTDVCPLNFENETLLQSDCLDLGRINQLISAAEIEFEHAKVRDPNLAINNSRIELDKLKDYLIQL